MSRVMRVCSIAGCTARHAARGWCQHHYDSWRLRGDPLAAELRIPFVNPLVCVCPEPVADRRRDFGMCQRCKRKPLALMAVA